jgi:hypothetical protein
MPWIILSSSAELPRGGADLRAAERERLLQDLLDCEGCLVAARDLIHRRDKPAGSAIDSREVANAWRKFFLAHYAFFHSFAILAEVYQQAIRTLEQGGWPQREIEQAAAIWSLAGALMRYGVDFAPTEGIYQQHIRPRMPEAFSGTWLREYALLGERRRRLKRALDERATVDRERAVALRTTLSEGERRYHTFHFEVMLACVPDMTSKLQQYEVENGKLVAEERQYEIYDEWFHVLRVPEIDLSGYVRSACTLLNDLLVDLMEGTYLETEPLSRLTAGIATVVEILRGSVRGEEAIQ